jgi:hypothetical protein
VGVGLLITGRASFMWATGGPKVWVLNRNGKMQFIQYQTTRGPILGFKMWSHSRCPSASRWRSAPSLIREARGFSFTSSRLKASRDVLLIADDVAKSYSDDTPLFTSLTFSVVVRLGVGVGAKKCNSVPWSWCFPDCYTLGTAMHGLHALVRWSQLNTSLENLCIV